MYPRNVTLTPNAQQLRKNMTPQERHLWYDFFKKISISAKRQYIIKKYIVDFYIPHAKLVVELDGSQHYDGKISEKDKIRDEELKMLGITVARYANRDIDENFEAVCNDILNRITLTY